MSWWAKGSVISFDFNNTNSDNPTDYFSSKDVAGAPGERVANWNNISAIGSDGKLSLSTVHDSAGVVVKNMTLSSGVVTGAIANGYSSTNTYAYGGTNPTHAAYGNDSKLFDHFLNLTSTTPLTITVTNIPYANYSLVAYRSDEESTAPGGDMTDTNGSVGAFGVNSVTYYLRGGPGNSASTPVPYSNTPDSTGSSYIFSTDTVNNDMTTKQANAVIFNGLSNATLNLSAFAGNAVAGEGGVRSKFVGFQIIDTTPSPEPSSFGMTLMCSIFFIGWRTSRPSISNRSQDRTPIADNCYTPRGRLVGAAGEVVDGRLCL